MTVGFGGPIATASRHGDGFRSPIILRSLAVGARWASQAESGRFPGESAAEFSVKKRLHEGTGVL
jgi:hypothetical protein